MTSEDPESPEVRQNSPFAGVLSQAQRGKVLESFKRRLGAGGVRRAELEHVLRSTGRIIVDRNVLIIGIQSVLGTISEDDLPLEATSSREVDVASSTIPTIRRPTRSTRSSASSRNSTRPTATTPRV